MREMGFDPCAGRCTGGEHGNRLGILAWEIPTEEPGGSSLWGHTESGHSWAPKHACILAMSLPWIPSCAAMLLDCQGPGLPHCEELFPSLSLPMPGHSWALLFSTALTCSCVLPTPGVITKMNNSSNQQAIFFFFFFLYNARSADNVCDCCKNNGMKSGASAKEKEEIYLTKLKWFRPGLRFLKLGPPNVLCPSSLPGWGAARETQSGWHGTQRWPLEAWRITVTVELFLLASALVC